MNKQQLIKLLSDYLKSLEVKQRQDFREYNQSEIELIKQFLKQW